MIFMSSFINFLKRNKLYSAVNLLGLSLSMAFVLLLAVYVTSQLNHRLVPKERRQDLCHRPERDPFVRLLAVPPHEG